MDDGKADRAFFEEHVAGRTGAPRDDVRLGPTYGADFGVVDVGDRVVALATDPVFVLRDLGLERAAWFAFHVCVSDVALSGLPPAHLAVDLNLPPGTSAETFDAVWSVFDREARELGTSLTTGHTGTYEGCSFPTVGGATALAVGDPADLVVPTGARPGDRVVVTKGPAIETTGVLACVFGDDLADALGESVVDAARERFRDASPVRDALTAAAAGDVSAMHDATERGLANAFHELAAASGVALAVERDPVPVAPGVREVCEQFGIDPWTASSEGTVVLTVTPGDADRVVGALGDEDIPAAVAGRVEEGSGVTVDGETLPEPESDPFWPAYRRARDRFGT